MDTGNILTSLILCGLMGLLGQGVRAAVGLKNSMGLPQAATQQATFSAAYFSLSLMIGFIAGVLAGLSIGFANLADMKVLLSIAAAGYAGADFIENTFSIVIPGGAAQQKGSVAPPETTAAAADGGGFLLQTLSAHTAALDSSVKALTTLVGSPSGPTTTLPPFDAALHSVAPNLNTQTWVPALSTGFSQFNIASTKRIAAAVGQFLVEAGDSFGEIVENLTYTHASRLVQIFPNEFPNEAAATPYLNNPEALGNKVYANKLGNGDEASGDGYRFRGRGLIQLTGRSEYAEFGATVGMTAEQAATYCETPAGAAISGCWYLSSRGCLPYADTWNITKITLLVNGKAMVGYNQRLAFLNAMLKALGG